MAYKIVWSAPAIGELEAIKKYISQDSESYAISVLTEMLDSVDRLAEFPRLGRRVWGINQDEIREMLVHQWRIIYQIGSGRIDILELIHCAQRRQGGI